MTAPRETLERLLNARKEPCLVGEMLAIMVEEVLE